jgi:hypothetical protein
LVSNNQSRARQRSISSHKSERLNRPGFSGGSHF